MPEVRSLKAILYVGKPQVGKLEPGGMKVDLSFRFHNVERGWARDEGTVEEKTSNASEVNKKAEVLAEKMAGVRKTSVRAPRWLCCRATARRSSQCWPNCRRLKRRQRLRKGRGHRGKGSLKCSSPSGGLSLVFLPGIQLGAALRERKALTSNGPPGLGVRLKITVVS